MLEEAKYSPASSQKERKATRLSSRELLKQIPDYKGDDDVYFLGDAAYNGKKNCKAIKVSGRIPIITPKKGQSPKGFNAWSDMLRFLEEHPRTYYGILRRRNNIENTFSSLKARFGTMVSTKSLKLKPLICWVWPSAFTSSTSTGNGRAIVGEAAHI